MHVLTMLRSIRKTASIAGGDYAVMLSVSSTQQENSVLMSRQLHLLPEQRRKGAASEFVSTPRGL